MEAHVFKNRVLVAGVVLAIVSVCLFASLFLSVGLQVGFNEAPAGFGELFTYYTYYLDYWLAYHSHPQFAYPQMGLNLFGPMVGMSLIAMFLLFVIRAPLMDMRPFDKKETIHGDAKWATEKDIKKMGLRSKQGVLLGDSPKGYLCAPGFQHILLFAPTGSGKGVGFVIPNLLWWTESVVVHDIKLENYELTSGYRKNVLNQHVYLWNAASPDGITHCYNALDWISPKMGQMVDDVQKISSLLLPEQEFWENEARSLCTGVMLYLLADESKVASLGQVVRELRSDDVVYNLAVVLDTMGKEIHPVGYMNLAAFLQKADKERSGVISTLNSKLELWTNPLIDAATASSDFDFNMIKFEPTTIYVGLTPDNIDRLKPLMQIFYSQAAQILTKHMPRPEEKVGVMFVMDEFPTLGEMVQFKQGIAYFRGYNLRLFLIIQDTEQLKDIYEEAGMNSFLANATYRITFAANTFQTAELISNLIGNKTVKQLSRNAPVFLDLNPASRSKTISEAQRALLLPQEVIGLPRDQQIILIESEPPIRTKKIFYYKDKFFTSRLLPMMPVPTQEPFDPEKEKLKIEEKKRLEEEAAKAKEAKEAEEAKAKELEAQKNKPQEQSQIEPQKKRKKRPTFDEATNKATEDDSSEGDASAADGDEKKKDKDDFPFATFDT